MKLKKILLILLIFSIYLIPSIYAEGTMREPHDFISDNIDFMKKELALNEDQVKKINSIMFDTFNQIEQKHLDIEKANIEIKEQLLKDNPDLNKIKASIDKKSGVMANIEFITIKRDLDIKAVLTPDQFMKWKTLRKPEPFMFFDTPFPPNNHHNNPIMRKPFNENHNPMN